jgi:hypothetical protein
MKLQINDIILMSENVHVFLWKDIPLIITLQFERSYDPTFITEILVRPCLFLHISMRVLTWVRLVTCLRLHYWSEY